MSDLPEDDRNTGDGDRRTAGEDETAGDPSSPDPVSDPAGADPETALEDLDVAAEDLPEDAFTEMETGEVDEDFVWAEVADDVEPAAEETADEVVIPKRKYCERCEYFASPPEATCTHEGTEILELVDMEHFRVVDCPVVAERRKIGATDIRGGRGLARPFSG